MILKKEYMPQYRDSDADGLVGARGYIACFQNIATEYLHNVGKGNDTMPDTYGFAWMYIRYKLVIHKKADFTAPIELKTWVSRLDTVRVWQELEVRRDGELYASGRLEECIYDLNHSRICKTQEAEIPQELREDSLSDIGEFVKLRFKPGTMQYVYTYTVRYTDLDRSHHMNNLHYVEMFVDAMTPEYMSTHFIKTFEIQYDLQAFYGEELKVYCESTENGLNMYAVHADGKTAAQCRIGAGENLKEQ